MGIGRRVVGAGSTVLLFCIGMVFGFAGEAAAVTTCEFDPALGTATVTVTHGRFRPPTALSRTAEGRITVNDTPCGAARVRNTDTINVNGDPDTIDELIIDLSNGPLAPGREPEAGSGEIEVYVDLGRGPSSVRVVAGQGDDTIVASGTALDLDAADAVPDEDLFFVGANLPSGISVYGEGGDDAVDLAAMTIGVSAHGGEGGDRLVAGSGFGSILYGDVSLDGAPGAGADTLVGGGTVTLHYGGLGDDVMLGGPGTDRFFAEPTIDGTDVMLGGPGVDEAAYHVRNDPVVVTLDGLANDGDPTGDGERDLIADDVEGAAGGRSEDVVVGNAGNNSVWGGWGDDLVDGGGGDDLVVGDLGNDHLSGGPGDDRLVDHSWGSDHMDGGDGNDLLDAGSGDDVLIGGNGDDLLDAGFGDDALTGGNGNDTMLGDGGADHLDAFDLQADVVDGGADLDIDVCECDPFDTITNIP